jgi:hypothetical protein
LFCDRCFAIIPTIFVIVLVAFFAVAILNWGHGEYKDAKEMSSNVTKTAFQGIVTAVLWAPQTVRASAIFMYCTVASCHVPPPIDKVIGGLIAEVGQAHNIFGMITEMGATGTTSLGKNTLK